MLGYFALKAWMTSSFGGSSLGSPQKDQVIVAAWVLACAAAGAAAVADAPVLAGAGPLEPVPPWQAASSDAEAMPSPALVANRNTARRENRADIGCSSFIHSLHAALTLTFTVAQPASTDDLRPATCATFRRGTRRR